MCATLAPHDDGLMAEARQRCKKKIPNSRKHEDHEEIEAHEEEHPSSRPSIAFVAFVS